MVTTRSQHARNKKHANEDIKPPSYLSENGNERFTDEDCDPLNDNEFEKSSVIGCELPPNEDDEGERVSYIMRLPNEVLLMVSSHLSQQNVREFCATSKRLNNILTPKLYGKISVGQRGLAPLTRTILDHPAFAQKTRDITIKAGNNSWLAPQKHLNLHPDVSKTIRLQSRSRAHLKKRSWKFVDNMICILLSNLSRIESLNLEIPNDIGLACSDFAFPDLKSLRIHSCSGTFSLRRSGTAILSFTAPGLTNLALDSVHTSGDFMICLPHTLTEFSFMAYPRGRPSWLMAPDHYVLPNVISLTYNEQTPCKPLLACCTQVKYITIYYAIDLDYMLPRLIQSLEPHQSTLKALHLRPPSYVSVRNYTGFTLSSFASFISLEDLTIPASSFTSQNLTKPSSFLLTLPRSIRSLTIIRDQLFLGSQLEVFAQISGDIPGSHFPELKSVLIATVLEYDFYDQEKFDMEKMFAERNIKFFRFSQYMH